MNITRLNYEEYFLLYLDNELGVEERQVVEAFINENGDLGEELRDLQKAFLQSDEVYSFDKGLLYKTENANNTRIISLWPKRLSAAAAILLLGSGAFWLVKVNRDSHPGIAYAGSSAKGPHDSAVPASGGAMSSTQTPDSNPATGASATPGTTGNAAPGSAAPGNVTPGSAVPGNVASPGGTGLATKDPADTKSPAIIPSGVDHSGQGSMSPSAGASGTLNGVSPETKSPDGSIASGATATGASASGSRAAGTSDRGLATTQTPGDATPLSAIPASVVPSAKTPGSSTPVTVISGDLVPASQTNTSAPVTIARTASYHTLEDMDGNGGGDNKILFVRADQVVTGGVKGFFRKAGRVIRHNTSINPDSVHPESETSKSE
jgi:hypothetical protein